MTICRPTPPESWKKKVGRQESFEPMRRWTIHRCYLNTRELVASGVKRYGQKKSFRFRFYSPCNAMLVHIQKPGAVFVMPAYRWKKVYGRDIGSKGERSRKVKKDISYVRNLLSMKDEE